MGPRFAIDRPEEGLAEWQAYFERLSLGVLSEAEAAEWRAAAARASAERSFLWAFWLAFEISRQPLKIG